MLGRKTYTRDEIENGRAAVAAQVAAYAALTEAAPTPAEGSRFEEVEPVYFGAMLLALDRRYVHRVRPVAGKDANPLNELELLAESLMHHDGLLHTGSVLKYQAAEAVLKLQPGERIRLSRNDFERLAAAFFIELEKRFGEPDSPA